MVDLIKFMEKRPYNNIWGDHVTLKISLIILVEWSTNAGINLSYYNNNREDLVPRALNLQDFGSKYLAVLKP